MRQQDEQTDKDEWYTMNNIWNKYNKWIQQMMKQDNITDDMTNNIMNECNKWQTTVTILSNNNLFKIFR